MEIEVLTGSRDAGDRQFTVFDSEAAPADQGMIERLGEGTDGAGLAAPPVVLPDFCHKAKSEMPSSIAVATKGEIRPALTDAALNCGMALMTLDIERPSASAVTDFYRQVAERFPSPPNWRRELTVQGGAAGRHRGGRFRRRAVRPQPTTSSTTSRSAAGSTSTRTAAPGGPPRNCRGWWSRWAACASAASGRAPTSSSCRRSRRSSIRPRRPELGIRPGQVTVQFHNGGGVLTGQLGALYARRKSASRMLRAEMAVQKPLTHLLTPRSGIKQRLAAYFTEGCPSVPVDGDDGRRALLATRLAMNYGFAYRMATYAELRQMARSAFGATASLVVDSPHNSIYEEEVDGTHAFVHRHNACRAYPAAQMKDHPVFAKTGQPLLLPGTNRTSSYLCVPQDTAHRSLYTACHGTGSIISAFERSGRSGPDPQGRTTARYRYDGTAPAEVPHLDDRGVDEALGILTGHGLVRPVARMRPFAVLT